MKFRELNLTGIIMNEIQNCGLPAVKLSKKLYNKEVRILKKEVKTSFTLLQNGTISLFWRPEIFEKHLKSLKEEGLDLCFFDCAKWTSEEEFHQDVASELQFPSHYGKNLDAFNDCLAGCIPESEGLVLAFQNYDVFNANFAEMGTVILDIIHRNSWGFLLLGKKLIALVQSNDPTIRLDSIGRMPAEWNPEEKSNKSRNI
ncbi:MAG: barstar family protein [Eubacteriales bacterium]